MARSLKERYETKRISTIQERVKRLDETMLLEHRTANLIVEAMDEEDLNKVAAIVQKLSSIKTPELPKLTAAIEQAEAEINKYTAGGPITKAWTKMKNLVGIDNPIVKVTTFADALEKGFSQIPQILKNNGVDLQNADLKQSLVTLLSGQGKKKGPETGKKSDKEMGDTSYGSNKTFSGSGDVATSQGAQNEADAPKGAIEGKLKNIIAQLQKALSPGGIFGAFKKVPYISSQELAQELIRVPLNAFANIARKINSGAKASEIAPDLKSQITQASAEQTKGTEPKNPVKHDMQTQPTGSPDDTSATTSAGTPVPGHPSEPRGGGSKQDYAAAQQKITKFINSLKGNKQAREIMAKKFVDAGLDPDKL